VTRKALWSQAGPSLPASLRSWGLVAVLAGGCAGLYFWLLAGLQPAGGDHPLLWPLVGLGTWAAGVQRLPVRNSRVSSSISLIGIPLIVAVPFLPPAPAVLAVFCGHLASQLQNRRPAAKALVNVLMCSATMCLAIVVYDHGLGGRSPSSLWGWWVAAGALAASQFADLAGILAATVLIAWRWRQPPIAAMVRHTFLDVALCSVGGILAIALVEAGTADLLLLCGLVAVADVGWQRALSARQRHGALEELYGFTRRLASTDDGERALIAEVLLGARSMLSASSATMVVPLDAPLEHLTLRCRLEGDEPLEVQEGAPRDELADLVASGGPLVLSSKRPGPPGPPGPPGTAANPRPETGPAGGDQDDRERHVQFERSSARMGGAIAAPLAPGEPLSGYLLVAGRAFSHEGFGPDDLRLLQALAANAAVALRKTGLLDKLRHEASLRHYEAHHDALTGLPNRTMLYERLGTLLGHPSSGTVEVGLALVDLDRFKHVNDTLGHHAGDLVLVEVARRLGPLAGDGTLVARLGGDEFAILAYQDSSAEGAAVPGAGGTEPSAPPGDARGACLAKAADALLAIAQPMSVLGLELVVVASAGVVGPVKEGTSQSTVLSRAEIAMYEAKSSGGGLRVYNPVSDRSTVRRLTMATELRKAIEGGKVHLHYQPVVDVVTGAVTGAEALARWEHEQFGHISPDEFIPVAERSGLIEPLTRWAIPEALGQLCLWRRSSPGLTMAVNLSAASLLRPNLAADIEAALQAAGLPASALRLELTESTLMAEPGEKALHELKDLGVALSVDDFGTGYSSLTRLKQLPFDEVKIDRSFVTHMGTSNDDEAVVRSVIRLAQGLEKLVTAEGVEDQEVLAMLAALGCNSAQGFYMGRPAPAREWGGRSQTGRRRGRP